MVYIHSKILELSDALLFNCERANRIVDEISLFHSEGRKIIASKISHLRKGKLPESLNQFIAKNCYDGERQLQETLNKNWNR